MRRALVVIATALPLALVACGDDDEDGPTGAETATTEEATSAEGPAGELTEQGIGEAEVGKTTAEVEDAFGAPDNERNLPGCELAGPSAVPILQWTWNLDDGSASIDFDANTEELVSYRTTSAGLPTANGVRVGDDFQTLRDSYGPTLKPLELGAPPTEQAGPWYVGDLESTWLLFTVAGGSVKTIQGGDITICE